VNSATTPSGYDGRPASYAAAAEPNPAAATSFTPTGARYRRPLHGSPDIAHLSGVVADALAGRMEGVTTDPWTQRQVDERADWPLDRIVDEWNGNAEVFEAALGPSTPPPLIIDITSHELDVRGALGDAGARQSDGVAFAVHAVLDGRTGSWPPDVPSVHLTCGHETWVLGPGEPAATLATGEFELVRWLLGRRSRRQVRALPWRGDPGAAIDELTVFGPAGDDLVE
jgi:hypothetical protein